MGVIRVLTQRGDETLAWDPADERSTNRARAEFDRLKGEGYVFYEAVQTKGKKVTRFDAKAGTLIAAPGGRTESDKRRGTRERAMAGGPVATYERVGRVNR